MSAIAFVYTLFQAQPAVDDSWRFDKEVGAGDLVGLFTALLAIAVAYYSGLKQSEESRRAEKVKLFYEAVSKFDASIIPAFLAVKALAERGAWDEISADALYEEAEKQRIATGPTFKQTSEALDKSAGDLLQAFQNVLGVKKNDPANSTLVNQLAARYLSAYGKYLSDKANGPELIQPTRRWSLKRLVQRGRGQGTGTVNT